MRSNGEITYVELVAACMAGDGTAGISEMVSATETRSCSVATIPSLCGAIETEA